MKAGKRDRKIVFERATVTKNAFNEDVETWAASGGEFAHVIFAKGSERRDAAQESASAAATFIVPANTQTNGVTVRDRIMFDGSAWDIVSNIPSRERNAEREIEAVRIAQ
ncbi:phage head completion protein [Sphingomonas sanxanigenens]|uniref:Head-tail adaptor protein n=1 Tax=Sphingomonas sanxanigenens DSM 19645 = NX02 TaxID=1123269 RepID=W0ADR2_9SPHN|nr:head-tail adaptor protein [Sphingomonas sanxanigenens]AHE56014.1 hypothetical protein NX02_21920 [Sphingomonas sanxanigenens DSM 19645 = NX02]